MRSDATGTPPPERHGRHPVASATALASPDPPTTCGDRCRGLHETGPELAFGVGNLERVLAQLHDLQGAAGLTDHAPPAARADRPTRPPAATGSPTPAAGVALSGSVPPERSRTAVADLPDLGPTTSQEQT
jgi:hypothetical protein